MPVETVEEWPIRLQGLSLRNVSLRVERGSHKIYEEQGEMLFTHFGVSGPLVLSASSLLGRKGAKDCKLHIEMCIRDSPNRVFDFRKEETVCPDIQKNRSNRFGRQMI